MQDVSRDATLVAVVRHTVPQRRARFPRMLGRTHALLDGPDEIRNFFARHGAARTE